MVQALCALRRRSRWPPLLFQLGLPLRTPLQLRWLLGAWHAGHGHHTAVGGATELCAAECPQRRVTARAVVEYQQLILGYEHQPLRQVALSLSLLVVLLGWHPTVSTG